MNDPSKVRLHWFRRAGLLALALFCTGVSAAPSAAQNSNGWLLAGNAGSVWMVVGFELGPWNDYLLRELSPDLERLDSGLAGQAKIGWMALDDARLMPEFAATLLNRDLSPVVLSLGRGRSVLSLRDQRTQPGKTGLQFEQSLIMPGLTGALSENNSITVSAILASQRYGSSGLNLTEADYPGNPEYSIFTQPYGRPDIVYGSGLRMALSSQLMDSLALEAAYQSRIDMAKLTTLQGLYGSVAELDIPSRVQLSVEWQASANASLRVGAEQIFYSEVGAFPSRSLPARFTSLLGDSTSPDFAWRNLIVYRIGWHWQLESDLAFEIDYRTRSQPLPTAPVLANALAPELAQNAVLAGLTKSFGTSSSLRLSAAYAPPEFAFGGNVLGVVTDQLDQSVEVQAMLQIGF